MGCAHANGFVVIAESLHVGVLRTSAAKGNICLAWRGESWLDDCLEFGPSSGQSHRSKAFVTRRQVPCWLKTSISGGGVMLAIVNFNYTLFSLQLRKSTQYLSQFSQHMLRFAFYRFDCFFICNFSGLLFPLTFSLHVLVSPRSIEMLCRIWGFLHHITLSL
jgi:hypothetical protein